MLTKSSNFPSGHIQCRSAAAIVSMHSFHNEWARAFASQEIFQCVVGQVGEDRFLPGTSKSFHALPFHSVLMEGMR